MLRTETPAESGHSYPIGLLAATEAASFRDLCHSIAREATDSGDGSCSIAADDFYTDAENYCRPGVTFEAVLRVDASIDFEGDKTDKRALRAALVKALRKAVDELELRLGN